MKKTNEKFLHKILDNILQFFYFILFEGVVGGKRKKIIYILPAIIL